LTISIAIVLVILIPLILLLFFRLFGGFLDLRFRRAIFRRLSSFNEILPVRTTVSTGIDVDDIFRYREILVWLASQKIGNSRAPDGTSGRAAGQPYHWFMLVVAYPHTNYNLWAIADSPSVDIVISRTGFNGNLAAGYIQRTAV
jgi:hypothetical protein